MGVRKDVISRQTASFLSYGLKRPFFFTPCMEAGCEKNLRFSSRSPRTSNFFPKSLQSAHRFPIWLFLDPGTKKERYHIPKILIKDKNRIKSKWQKNHFETIMEMGHFIIKRIYSLSLNYFIIFGTC